LSGFSPRSFARFQRPFAISAREGVEPGMAHIHAKRQIAPIAVMAATLVAGTATAASGPRHDASIDQAAAERIALRMGTMRGSIEPGASPVTTPDAMPTHSVQSSSPAILPALVPFSGPAFALFHEPIARPLPDRQVRIVYGGSLIVAAAEGW
jgi:hypothetical protein